MYLKLVTFSGKPNQLVNVIEAILYVDILAGFLFATLIDIQDLTNMRSEEHTSELQSRRDLVCRLLLEKKKNIKLHVFLMRGEDAEPRASRWHLTETVIGLGRSG